jgi:hypothetical protein
MEHQSEDLIHQLNVGEKVILVRHARSRAQSSVDEWNNNGGSQSEYVLNAVNDDLRD